MLSAKATKNDNLVNVRASSSQSFTLIAQTPAEGS